MTQPRVVIVDHFDSFTYNIVQGFEELGCEVIVVRTDQCLLCIEQLAPTQVVLSPGPGHPKDVPLFFRTIELFQGRLPILGICLGHQAIAEFYGARVVRNFRQMHGKISPVHHRRQCKLFHGLQNPFNACRYHSLVADKQEVPGHGLSVLAWTDEGEVMAIQHQRFQNIVGVQFHPESIFTEGGMRILENFVEMRLH